MAISHTHRYLFIEIPLTASWAIRHKLCDRYAGRPILHKHASYPEFLRIATLEERGYFVFATVRHPLDVAVSRYFKVRTDHKGAFSDLEVRDDLRVDRADLRKYNFVRDNDAGFVAYSKRSRARSFNCMIDLSRPYLDFVIRYEDLQRDFSQVLQRLGIEQVAPIPVTYVKRGKRRD
jgi:hypothetical protein